MYRRVVGLGCVLPACVLVVSACERSKPVAPAAKAAAAALRYARDRGYERAGGGDSHQGMGNTHQGGGVASAGYSGSRPVGGYRPSLGSSPGRMSGGGRRRR